MWSASMLVTTASTGLRLRNEASLSSASTTMYSPAPSRECAPALCSLPPMTKVGSTPAAASTLVTSEVVVVLPCVPAIAMPRFRRISSASITARGTTGTRRARAAMTSGLSPRTAVEVTTASAPSTCAASWPIATRTPIAASRRVLALSTWSDPETA